VKNRFQSLLLFTLGQLVAPLRHGVQSRARDAAQRDLHRPGGEGVSQRQEEAQGVWLHGGALDVESS
jgi:hypothetical protein